MSVRTTYYNVKREWRCTRNASGTKEILNRQGYYIKAYSLWHAIEIMSAKFPDEAASDEGWDAKDTDRPTTFITRNFTFSLWK